jgi:hypothetical protein
MSSGSGVRIVEIDVPGERPPHGEKKTIFAELTAVSGPSDVSARRVLHLDDARDTITDTARWVFEAVRAGLPRAPDKIGIDFGIKLAVKSGKLTSVLAEVGGEATVTVRLEWSPGQVAPAATEVAGPVHE